MPGPVQVVMLVTMNAMKTIIEDSAMTGTVGRAAVTESVHVSGDERLVG
jgi:hypothetical protein